MNIKMSKKQIKNESIPSTTNMHELNIKVTGTDKEVEKFNIFVISILVFISEQLK